MVRGPEPVPQTDPPASGYRLRQYEEADRGVYWRLFAGVFETRSRLDDLRSAALPGGFHVIEYEPDRAVVASAVAAEYERDGHTEPGSLQWVMANPGHSGHGLGKAVVAAASQSLADAGYSRVYLSTDDWRLPAIHVYLELGWKPLIFAEDMQERWSAVYKKLRRGGLEADAVIEMR